MVFLSNGAFLDMQWKQIKYQNHDDFIVFQIIPMVRNRDVVVFPSQRKWKKIVHVFSLKERKEIISFIEKIVWKRDIKIIELDIDVFVNQEIPISIGMIEATEGYIKLSNEHLFDPDSKLEKEQVKFLFCRLEERFAESISGAVVVPKETIINGSVMKEITIPILEKKQNIIVK